MKKRTLYYLKKVALLTSLSSLIVPIHSVYAAQAASVKLEAKSNSKTKGQLEIVQKGKEVLIKGEISGLGPNTVHGFHVHENGDCSAKDGSSAGGHFNPMDMNHGGPEMDKHHVGDLGNIRANKKGKALIDKKYKFLTLEEAKKASILNKAIIVHSKADDLESQPSGDAGKRIACGIIKESKIK